jgi:acyl phosphate:glycerol-3-phosphate acyltransferase
MEDWLSLSTLSVIKIIVCFIGAYLIGSVSTAVWAGKAFHGIDVRTKGSGNAGATNTIRVLGVKTGVIVMIIDVFKGWLAVALTGYFLSVFVNDQQLVIVKIISGLFAVAGHIFPLYTGFRGGKGVATFVGVILALYPLAFFIVLIWFVIVFILTRYVSLGSVSGAIIFPFIVVFILNEQNIALIVLSIIIAVFIPLTHHKNIKRLLKGTENKLYFNRK